MGYFANGTEGESYEARYCNRCVHGLQEEMCVVWELHMLHNYEQFDKGNEKIKDILDMLIPRKGCKNKECKLFREYANAPLPGQMGFDFMETKG